jgi:hypothetical protein
MDRVESRGRKSMKKPKLILRFLQTASAALVVLTIFVGAAKAGSVIGELEYRYPCTYQGQRLEVSYSYRRDAVTAGIQFEAPGPTVIVVNERKSREQPPELVTFEFFSACQQAQSILFMFETDRADEIEDQDFLHDMILRADCDAIALLKREGLLYGSKGYSYIMDIFYYERTRERYFGVAFPERADNIQENCPI